nr:hypothetical protein GCM10020092_059260 [Actinoplanes digitatis]
MASGLVALLTVADMVHFAHSAGSVTGQVVHNPVSTACWLLGLVVAGAAAMHPSIARPTEAGPLRLRFGVEVRPLVQIVLALLGPAVTAVSLLDELVAEQGGAARHPGAAGRHRRHVDAAGDPAAAARPDRHGPRR